MALYDLATKAAKLPLYRLLGGEKRKVETDITVGIGSPGKMAETALKFKEQGARIIKIKLGKNAAEDIERVKQIRAAVGTDARLRLDANQGWSYQEARLALNRMETFDIEFCEQPMRSYDDEYLPVLCNQSPVKIMADESCYDHHDARRLIKDKACHYINIKLAKTGSISEALKIQDHAAAAGIGCMMGGMLESRLGLSAKLHIVYASPGIIFYDMDTCMIGHLLDPVTGGVKYEGYFLDIDDAIGIGADVDPAFLESC